MLVSEAPAIRREALIEAAQRERLPELAIPRDIIAGVALPLLGSGKTDYPAVQRLASAAETGRGNETARAVAELKKAEDTRCVQCRAAVTNSAEAFVRSCEMR